MSEAHTIRPIEFFRHLVVALFVFAFVCLGLLFHLGVESLPHLFSMEIVVFGSAFLAGNVILLSMGLLFCSSLVLPLMNVPKEVSGVLGVMRFAIVHSLFLAVMGALSLWMHAKMY